MPKLSRYGHQDRKSGGRQRVRTPESVWSKEALPSREPTPNESFRARRQVLLQERVEKIAKRNPSSVLGGYLRPPNRSLGGYLRHLVGKKKKGKVVCYAELSEDGNFAELTFTDGSHGRKMLPGYLRKGRETAMREWENTVRTALGMERGER